MLHNNTKKFTTENGLVTGIELQVYDVPNQEYVISHLRLIDEEEANGRTIAYCSSTDGRGDFYLSFPWRPGDTNFQNSIAVGGSNGQHVITNGYSPPDLGWLAIHMGKKPISQIVGGLGLPFNRHVSFEIVFTPKDSIVPPSTDLEARVLRIENFLNSWK